MQPTACACTSCSQAAVSRESERPAHSSRRLERMTSGVAQACPLSRRGRQNATSTDAVIDSTSSSPDNDVTIVGQRHGPLVCIDLSATARRMTSDCHTMSTILAHPDLGLCGRSSASKCGKRVQDPPWLVPECDQAYLSLRSARCECGTSGGGTCVSRSTVGNREDGHAHDTLWGLTWLCVCDTTALAVRVGGAGSLVAGTSVGREWIVATIYPNDLDSAQLTDQAPGTRVRRLRGLGTFAEPAPEPEAKKLAQA